jgi:Luciferase-like monooxygenase
MSGGALLVEATRFVTPRCRRLAARHGCKRSQIGADAVNSLTTSVFDLPDRLFLKADPTLIARDEQHFATIAERLEQVSADLSDRLDAERKAPGGTGRRALDRDQQIRRLTPRLRYLPRFGVDLCQGRIVSANNPEPVYVGRRGPPAAWIVDCWSTGALPWPSPSSERLTPTRWVWQAAAGIAGHHPQLGVSDRTTGQPLRTGRWATCEGSLTMRFSINIPNFGDFADAGTVARVAVAAEQAGWDALFVWDHVVHDKRKRQGQPFGDPWMLLTAAALATSNLRLGTMVTPVARRRPEQLARQVATLDSLSGGRVIFCAGLGGPVEDEFASFGDTTDPVVLAERLDEGLGLLERYWSGDRLNHHGRHYQVQDVMLLPASVQRPRPPVWIGGFWPHRRPMRRAARWDGVVPLFIGAGHGHVPPLDQVCDLVGYVSKHRKHGENKPFEIVLGGASPGDPVKARDLIAPLFDAGATWWDERQLQTSENVHRLTPVLRRIDKGPPAL